jgi:hypothetical protein
MADTFNDKFQAGYDGNHPLKNANRCTNICRGSSIQQSQQTQEGSDLPVETSRALLFWEYLETWGGTWMWEDINNSQATKAETLWIAAGLEAGSLI